MGLYKLLVHQKAFSNEDLIINPKHFPNFKKGDIIEIYHPEDEFSRLLLQITAFKEDLQGKEAISVEQSIAFTFQLRTYSDVKVGLVNPSLVTLDSVELTFKDQYLGRSDMWRLKNHMMDTCVYLNKKIEFCGGTVRCHVYEMWSHGERVACGVISENTKVVFRSSTSMVYLFLQMSSEMWDFDIHGDLYFEKAVNGFLADLFQKWKKHGSNHEVTIVLFSRTYYEANSLEDFPEFMQECLQKDYKGRYYEDFYRVAVQNERYDDWSNVLRLLRRHFIDYHQSVLNHHQCAYVDNMPRAFNSCAAQGNFLEVLNMSLNVFEKHYLDRSFDRTGQLSVVITPGVGVFAVDRELTNVTKQRIIDSGVGSDLVCVGEQPLHAVPLLKFHNKDSIITADDYSMPHWINLSFYSNKKPSVYSNFIPRIKLPSLSLDSKELVAEDNSSESEDETFPNNVYDHDAFDSQVFNNLPTVPCSKLSSNRLRYSRGSDGRIIRRKTSDPHIDMKPTSPYLNSIAQHSLYRTDSSPQTANYMINGGTPFPDSYDSTALSDMVDSPPPRLLIGSAGVGGTPTLSLSPQKFLRPGRALINPFDPSHVTVKLTSNRRRWTHIFPKGPTGVLIQQHHYQAVPTQPQHSDQEWEVSETDSPFVVQGSKLHSHSASSFSKTREGERGSKKSQILLWGATGEQEWTPALTTGVDWKSLTIPACLPITTDYFPDSFYLRNDYLFSEHDLIPDAVNADAVSFAQRPLLKKALTTEQVFQELISQRLAQGFQLVVKNENSKDMTSSVLVPKSGFKETKEYILSIGRIFHRIKLSGSKITVTRYVPRHPYPTFQVHYRYRFQAPDHATYGVSWVSFNTEKLESYKWNYLDHYICMRGDSDFPLFDNQYKFWRFRMYLLPLSHSATRKVLDGSKYCDIYTMNPIEDQKILADGFCRFVETWVNRLRRVNTNRRRLELQAHNSVLLLTRRRHSTGILYLTQHQKTGLVVCSRYPRLIRNVLAIFAMCSRYSQCVRDIRNVFAIFAMCSRYSQCVRDIRNVFAVFAICSRYSQCVRGIRNMFAVFAMCSRYSQYVRGIRNMFAVFAMCSRYSQCVRDIRNVFVVIRN
ncbi:hypothetical protein M8J77_004068 [Diaphorina citri]|nr:hypothetical protein M8J77_004068 [Diaphorina citri]